MEKAKMAMAMMNPATQLKLSKIFGWVEDLVEAVRETGLEVGEVKNGEDLQGVLLKLLGKAKVKHIEEKNALVLELGKEKKVRLTLSFKEVE
ncbi:hypothetical protein [Thermococcus nautili]|uniref:Uncharacterized protein n=1 Tax=Thermococcus nautili TaxID=195522 RepID=U3RPL5_9EURY|nr:hypothetical protein [Thermococcus nautili]AGX15316.1 hypothetical protein TNaP3-02 [Thermococcus nautili]AHL21641.1 hypothetical protein BD01_0002 [Thermococcus nautili]